MKKLRISKPIILIMLILVLLFGVSVFGKYINLDFHSYYLNAKHFYFTSNRLKRVMPTYLVNNWSGVGSFNISFDLSSEKNSHVHTEYDIPYEVIYMCPQDVICSVDKASGTVYNNASTGYSDTVTLSVTPTRSYAENEKLTIEIKARSTSPYIEEIKARFEYVVGKKGVTYEIEDEANRAYLLLKITNAITYCTVTEAFGDYAINDEIDINVYKTLNSTDQSKCVGESITIDFDPTKLLLDTTLNMIDSSTYHTTTISGTDYISDMTFYVNPVSTAAIKFYKIDTTKNYTYPIVNAQSVVGVTIN